MYGFETMFRNAFFSGMVCVGFGALRGIEAKKFWAIGLRAFFCGGLSSAFSVYSAFFTGRLVCSAIAVIMIKLTLKDEDAGYLPYIIPALYCVAPGKDMYSFVLYLLEGNLAALEGQLEHILKVATGCCSGMIIADEILKRFHRAGKEGSASGPAGR